MFNTLKIKNDEVIITHNPPVEKDSAGIKQAVATRYRAVCEWFGIDGCVESQIYFPSARSKTSDFSRIAF
ncbi:hypothetical protein ACT7C1_21985 [Bacillus paranthracis]